MDKLSGYLLLAPNLSIVRLEEGKLLLRSEVVSLTIEGSSAKLLLDDLLPLLNGQHRFEDVQNTFPDLEPASLKAFLNQLANAGAIFSLESSAPDEPPEDGQTPQARAWSAMGLEPQVVSKRLQKIAVAVFGLEAHGARAALELARLGFGKLVLVDPFPLAPHDYLVTDCGANGANGMSRQVALASLISERFPGIIATTPLTEITKESVREVIAGVRFAVSAFDYGFSAVSHWINHASIAHRVAAVYTELRPEKAIVGPLVFPHETGCFMCYRMRELANAENYEESMAFEEHLTQLRKPALRNRAFLPTAAGIVGGLVATELMKTALAIGTSSLANRTLDINLMLGETSAETLLVRPDCPVCQKKSPWVRNRLTLQQLAESNQAEGKLLEAAEHIVGSRTGIVRQFGRVHKDPREPETPIIFRAELANSRFGNQDGESFQIASGKGMTADKARQSALGEAIERYSASMWTHEEVVFAQQSEMAETTLDPRRLVLYDKSQYDIVKYTPYHEQSALGWVKGLSLITGSEIRVPAIAAFLSYELSSPQEYLFPITSNGLAAGSTLPRAILSAALEVIERDAFLAMWLHRLPCARYDIHSHPSPEIRAVHHSYQRRGVEIELFAIPMDHPVSVLVAIGFEQTPTGGPAAVVGLGASFEPAEAARSAVLEVAQVRPALRIKLREEKTMRRLAELLADPSSVTTLEDHDLLYASQSRIGSFDFLRNAREERKFVPSFHPKSTLDQLRMLTAILEERASDLIYVDLTPPDIRPYGIHTVRAILPDFQPIYFGHKEARLGGHRLFDIPQMLGLRPDRASIADLNPDPHPLA